MPRQSALSTFVRRQCANYDGYYRVCVRPRTDGSLEDPLCAVLHGEPCDYFERAVLGRPDYPYKTTGYDWGRLFEQYGRINKDFAARGIAVRRCECGADLRARERVCEKCRERKRRETYRKYRDANCRRPRATVKPEGGFASA